jgi:hypothetical protein
MGGEFMVGPGARLVLGKPEVAIPEPFGIQVSGDTIGSGEGTILFNGTLFSVQAGKTARFDMSLSGGGVEIDSGGELAGNGTFVNEGRMLFREGVSKTTFENEGTLVIDGLTTVTNLRLEDSQLTNRQLILQKANQLVTVIRNNLEVPIDVIVNEGTWLLEDGSELVKLVGDSQFFNSNRGTLKMESTGQARMRMPFKNEGLVHLVGGRLVFDHPTIWDAKAIGTNLLQFGSGGILEFNDSNEEEFTIHTFRSDAELFGDGQLELKNGLLDLSGDSEGVITLTNSGTDIRIYDPMSFANGGELWNREGTVTFVGEGELPGLPLNITLRNGDRQVVELPANFTLTMGTEVSRIHNEGEFNVVGPTGLSDTIMDSLGSDPKGRFINTGFLTINADTLPSSPTPRIEPVFDAAHEGINGTVELKNKNNLNIVNPSSETVMLIQGTSDRYNLLSGEWIVWPDCVLRFGDRFFTKLGRFASVVLMGHQSDANSFADGRISGFPRFTGDFTNEGQLTLTDGAVFSINLGDFFNKGTIRCNPGTIIVDNIDADVFRNDGSVFGSPTIEAADIQNFGFIAPGDSPGTVTLNGNFTQDVVGELQMELGGTVPGVDYDQLIVNGIATLGGCLRLIYSDETFPGNGTTFMPVVATALVGQFDEIIYDVPSGRQVFDVVVAETGVTASAMTLDVSTFAGWQAGVFTAEEQADENISGLTADPDEDGLANLLEYALDGNPKVVTQPRLLSHFSVDEDGAPQTVEILFSWANGMTDVQYALEFSTDLETWDPLNSELQQSGDQGLFSVILLSADLPPEIDGRVFVRLLVSEI